MRYFEYTATATAEEKNADEVRCLKFRVVVKKSDGKNNVPKGKWFEHKLRRRVEGLAGRG